MRSLSIKKVYGKTVLVLIIISSFFLKINAQNGSCVSPSLIVQNDGQSSPSATFTDCITNPTVSSGTITIYTEVLSSADGTLGLVQRIQVSGACVNANINNILASRVAELYNSTDCDGVAIASYTNNAGNSATFNPEWSGLIPSTSYIVKITMTIPNACLTEIQELCLEEYYPALPATADECGTCLSPTCPIFEAPDFATSTAVYPNSNRYDPVLDLQGPLTFTNCYSITMDNLGTLGVKQGVQQSSACSSKTYSLKSDCNLADITPTRTNSNGTASGFNPEWDNLPAGSYFLCITTTLPTSGCLFDYSQTGFYQIPNPVPVCPTENTFITLDWSQNNSFIPFTNTTFDCNDGPQNIWKNLVEATWADAGAIQPLPGFFMDFATNTNSPTRTSILVNIDGQPFSYYGPTGTAPIGVLDWGPVTDNLSNLLVLEPYLPAGANISLLICDTRNAVQNFQYTIYDYANGQLLTSGTASPTNGNCVSVDFTLSSPTINWDIDGVAANITNNNDGGATFDPADLGEGQHTINFSFSNGVCNLNSSITIDVNADLTPTFDPISDLCLNSQAPLLPSISLEGISGSWNSAISTASLGTTTYTFTPDANQCASSTTLDVTVTDQITPFFDAISDLCLNSTAPNLPATSTNGINGTWNSVISTTVIGSTTYTFAPSANQCATNATIDVNILDPIVPTFGIINPICENEVIPTLSNTSNNAITGTWNTNLNNLNAGPNTLIFTPNSSFCAESFQQVVIFYPAVIAEAEFIISNTEAPSVINFTNLSQNATSYSWDFGNSFTSLDTDPSVTLTENGIYNVQLTASNGVCNDDIWTATIILESKEPLTYQVPNVFSPNSGTENNFYYIDIQNGKSFEARIINRWGNVIYEMNELNQKWDGIAHNGKEAEEGVYYIQFKIEGLNGELVNEQTFFHLVK